MTEIKEIALKLGIHLAPDIVEISFQKGKQFPYEAKTSFQRDVESKGKKNEGDLFGGTVIRYGKELNISTDAAEHTYNILLNSIQIQSQDRPATD